MAESFNHIEVLCEWCKRVRILPDIACSAATEPDRQTYYRMPDADATCRQEIQDRCQI